MSSNRTTPVKSPLRYPGGKSRAVQMLLDYFPARMTTLCSPFLGGGSLELALASRGVRVKGYDSFDALVNFWQVLLQEPYQLSQNVKMYYPLTPTTFYNLQKTYGHWAFPLEQASIFYVLNRASFCGTTFSGGMSRNHPRFTESGIENLVSFKADNLSVKRGDFKQSLEENKDHFLYCDPPYMNGQRLYGNKGHTHKGFDHCGLADILKGRGDWILSYNDCEEVRHLYNDHKIITPKWAYGMGENKTSNEVLILSKE